MKKLNQNGFSVVEGLLIFVIVGIIGGVGLYVNNKIINDDTGKPLGDTTQKLEKEKETEPKPKSENETASWTLFTSSKNWSMKIPDGWKLYTDQSSSGLTAYSSLKYSSGTKATITKTSSGRGGPFILNTGNYAAGDPATANPSYLTNESVFKASNVEGRKYSGVLKEDIPMEGSKGDTIYRYVFVKNSRAVIISHYQAKGNSSILTELESALATLKLN